MRFLIITGIFPPDIGGPATYVPNVANYLCDQGHQIELLTLSDGLTHDDAHFGFRIKRILRSRFLPFRYLQTIRAIFQLGRQADLIYVNGLGMESALANLFLHKPLVTKIVGDAAWEKSRNRGLINDTIDVFQDKRYGSLRVEFFRKIRGWRVRQSHRVIVPSQYLKEIVQKWDVKAKKIEVIYNAVEIPQQLPHIEIPLDTPYKIVMINRLVPWKKIDQVIKLMPELSSQIGLVVVGGGPLHDQLETLSKDLNLTHRIWFAGHCSQKKTLGILNQADLFLLNSTYEGLPHVVIEALKLNVPAVATAVGGTTELIQDGENGYLIESGNLAQLKEKIMAVTGIPGQQATDRQRLNPESKLAAEFSLDVMLQSTEKLLIRSSYDRTS